MTWIREFLNKTPKEKRKWLRDALEPRHGYQDQTWQQLVFRGLIVCFTAYRPMILYLLLAPFLAYIGMQIRHYTLGEDAFISASGNFYYVLAQICVLVYLYRSAKKKGMSLFEAVGLQIKGARWKLCGWCAAFGAFLSLMLSAIITLLPGLITAGYTADSARIFQRTDLLLVLLSLGIFTPVVEEILIRGYLLNGLLSFFTDQQAVLISAFIFAVFHVQPLWILYTFFLGILMAKLAIKEDNILYSMLMHAGFNFPSILNAVIQCCGAEKIFFGSHILILFYGLLGAAGAYLMLQNIQREEELWRI